jgi:hypothetical protein
VHYQASCCTSDFNRQCALQWTVEGLAPRMLYNETAQLAKASDAVFRLA